eukprot:CAMPEP_0115836462 /NCGR_PEP_ID=MMETSP0287-20121206/4719_1 /TAXON_ID=412157 /ORGANISM="Chrysochromulina rotalis, Strain UIO044" /LENGTH=336 /DNA_ID=CAMNT_0003289945 /DNA_START=102 /DNA_END=1112 /DNA_ORIENTATION=-
MWVAQQCVLQVTIIMRNSGTQEALTKRFLKKGLGKFEQLMTGEDAKAALKEADHANDPLMRLQFLARLGWQFDLADVAALIATPSIVTFFVWRDSFYTLQGTTILVRNCDLRNLWIRFLVLLCIKPAASTLARSMLRSKMRKTLLGKETMHGTSQLAAKIMAERKITKSANGDEKVKQAFGSIYVDEELQAVNEELSLSGLNFAITRARAMKKWRFYLCVIVLQLFSAFPVRRRGPGRAFEDGEVLHIGTCDAEADKQLPLSISSVWYYVPPNVSLVTDCAVNDAFQETMCNTAVGWCDTIDRYGWTQPDITIVLEDGAKGFLLNASLCEVEEGEE